MQTQTTKMRTNPTTFIACLLTLCSKWRQRRRERTELRRLSDRELHDIGITRVDAMREAGKPFWR